MAAIIPGYPKARPAAVQRREFGPDAVRERDAVEHGVPVYINFLERFAAVIREGVNLIPEFPLFADGSAEDETSLRYAAAEKHLASRRALDVIGDSHGSLPRALRAPRQGDAVELKRQVEKCVVREGRALVCRRAGLIATLEEDQRAALDFHFEFSRITGGDLVFDILDPAGLVGDQEGVGKIITGLAHGADGVAGADRAAFPIGVEDNADGVVIVGLPARVVFQRELLRLEARRAVDIARRRQPRADALISLAGENDIFEGVRMAKGFAVERDFDKPERRRAAGETHSARVSTKAALTPLAGGVKGETSSPLTRINWRASNSR